MKRTTGKGGGGGGIYIVGCWYGARSVTSHVHISLVQPLFNNLTFVCLCPFCVVGGISRVTRDSHDTLFHQSCIMHILSQGLSRYHGFWGWLKKKKGKTCEKKTYSCFKITVQKEKNEKERERDRVYHVIATYRGEFPCSDTRVSLPLRIAPFIFQAPKKLKKKRTE